MTLKEVLQVAAYIENNQDQVYNENVASTSNGTVIITTINAAWTDMRKNNPNMLDTFIDNMRAVLGTKRLLRHVVLGCMDKHAYKQCMSLTSSPNPKITINNSKSDNEVEHNNFQCVEIWTPGVDFLGEKLYLTSDYIKMMWRRIEFLSLVLQLGYNFIFMVKPGKIFFYESNADYCAVL